MASDQKKKKRVLQIMAPKKNTDFYKAHFLPSIHHCKQEKKAWIENTWCIHSNNVIGEITQIKHKLKGPLLCNLLFNY